MTTSILYFIIAFFVAAFLAFWLYYSKRERFLKQSAVIAFLRFLSLFALFILILNPKWEQSVLSYHKPKLVVAVDNSASINYLDKTKSVKNRISKFEENQSLNDKFDIDYFSFGETMQVLDSLDFSELETNQTQLIKQLNKLYSKTKTPIVLLTDGNQTKGSSYEYISSKNPIYPIVVGDTLNYADCSIDQLNSNQYAFLGNKFPVEIFTVYTGEKPTTSQLDIFRDGKRLYTKKIVFNKNNDSQKITLNLTADQVGQHFYSASLRTFPEEKNTYNNKYDFTVEVVDQTTNILLVSSFYHPDLGALKKSIETNKQRKVKISVIPDASLKLSDYQLVIVYQPAEKLRTIFKDLETNKLNSFIITGTHTDWPFLNSIQTDFYKNSTKQLENYQAVYNPNYNEFVTNDIDFNQLPPLIDIFGTIQFKVPHQNLLYQKIGAVATEQPLLTTYVKDQRKNVVLFGEGLWKWRMDSKIDKQSFESFDAFINTLVQYAASSKHREQLHLTYKSLVYNNNECKIEASYVDQNYKIDKQASLVLQLTNNKDKTTQNLPFYLNKNVYQVSVPNLTPSEYTFKVKVLDKNTSKMGRFKVLAYNIEQQFTSANKDKLAQLANRSAGELAYADNPDKVIQNILNDKQYQTIQKSKKITTALIEWYWLLAFIVVSLSAEWFIRKYKGLI